MKSILIKNAAQIASPKPDVIRGDGLKTLSITENGSIYIKDGVIQGIAKENEIEKMITDQPIIMDAKGKTILPGFVDSHSHLVFGGRRDHEFARRCSGVPYLQIANEGGGILSTVRSTREMSLDELVKQGLFYLEKAKRQGITTMEIKSGYGLNEETELKTLEVIQKLKLLQPIELHSTFLGAHAVPPDVEKNTYIEQVISMIPKAAKLAQYCDVFCEKGYFSAEDTRKILEKAIQHGMRPRVHVNQFNNIGGVQVAIDMNAASVDHLEEISAQEIDDLAKTNIGCTLLPGVSFFLNIKYPPARKIIDGGCIPVIATDFNPGSSMTLSMSLALSIACTQMGFGIEEAISAASQNAAHSLGLDKIGCLEPGWQADLIVLDTDSYHNLVYFFGEHHIDKVIKKGAIIWDRSESWD